MLPKFASSIRWFAFTAMILCCCLAAMTGCTKKAYAGDCSLNQQLNGHCQVQQFVAPQRIIVQQQVQPYHYQQQLVQQVVVPHRQQVIVRQQFVQPHRQQIVLQNVHGHQQLRQQVIVQKVQQPRQRSVQRQRIVTRSR